MTKLETLQLKLTATRVRMGLLRRPTAQAAVTGRQPVLRGRADLPVFP